MWAVTSLPSSRHTSRTHAKKQISVRIVGCWTLVNHAAGGEMLLSAGKSCHQVKVPAACLAKASLGSGGAEGKDKCSSLLPPQGYQQSMG